MSSVTKLDDISLRIVVAKTFFQRAVGLLGRSRLSIDEGMYFPRSHSVHTFGMQFAIDVVYFNEFNVIVGIHHSLQPFRISWCRDAYSLCELSEGAAFEFDLQKGQKWLIHSQTGDLKCG
jgi:uncharacterized protein